jgi:hypothetical protein
LIDEEDKTQFVKTYLRKPAMEQEYREMKNNGTSHLKRAKIEIVITKVYP